MRNLKKTIKSYWFLLRFYLYIFVVLIPKIPYFKYLTKNGRIGERTEKVFKAVQKWADYSVKIGKSKVTVNGLEKIPADRPVLFVSNHESYADIPMLIYALRDFNFGFMLKSTIADIPLIKNYLEYMYCVTVDQSDIRRGASAINRAADFINSGKSLLIFPEGTVVRNGVGYIDGLPAHAKSGAAMIGVRTGAKLVPVFMDGEKKLFHKTRIIFGDPYEPVYTGRHGTSEEMQKIADDLLREAYALGGQSVGGAPL